MQYLMEVVLIPPFLYCLPLLIMRTLLDCRFTREEFFGYVGCCAGCFFILFFTLPNFENIVLRTSIEFLIIFVMELVFIKKTFVQISISFGLTVIVVGICETLLFTAMISNFHTLLEEITHSDSILHLNLIMYVSSYLMIYAIYAVRKFQKRESSNQIEHKLLIIFTATVLLLSIIIVVKLERLSLNIIDYAPLLPYISSFILFSILCCVIFIRHSFREKSKNEEIMQYQKTLIELYDETRIFRHEYKNTMNILFGFCKEKNLEGLQKKIEENLGEFDYVYNDASSLEIFHIENVSLKWTLLHKIFTANKLGIKVGTLISKTLEDSLFEKKSLITVICNLLDNAIDASKESTKKQIAISILYTKPDTIISISNTYKNKPNIEKIFDRNYTTKHKHEGIGLYTIKKIISQYDNIFVNVVCDEEKFCFELNILNSELRIE